MNDPDATILRPPCGIDPDATVVRTPQASDRDPTVVRPAGRASPLPAPAAPPLTKAPARPIARMQRSKPLAPAHIPATGHTPLLHDRHQTATVADWLHGATVPFQLSIPHAGPRGPAPARDAAQGGPAPSP